MQYIQAPDQSYSTLSPMGGKLPLLYFKRRWQVPPGYRLNTITMTPSLSLATLEAANINVKGPGQSVFSTLPFVPVVDGDFIQERPFEALKQNKING
ncbi:hypothetical protein H0H93_002122, partial [Arthromyces matolae]